MTKEQILYNLVSSSLREYISHGIKPKDIAADCGLSTSTVRKFAYAQTQYPRMHTVLVVLDYLGYEITIARKQK